MDYDLIIQIVGRSKSYFILSLFAISFVTYVTNIHRNSFKVSMFQPRFHCKIPENLLTSRDSQNISVYISLDNCFLRKYENQTFQKCQQFQFDRLQMSNTFITENKAVCMKNHIRIIIYFLQIINIPLIIIFGFIADKIGRKITIILLLVLHTIFQVTIGLVKNMWVNVAFMALNKLSILTELIGFIWIIEMNSCDNEPIIISLYFIFGIISSFIISMITFLSMKWRFVYLITGGTMVFWLFILFIPESPRWLLIKNKHKKFYEAIKSIADINKVELPTNLIEDFIEYSEWNDISKFSIKEFWRHSKVRNRLFILCFVVFSINLFHPYFIIDISQMHSINYGLAYFQASVIFTLFLIPLWIIVLWSKRMVRPAIMLIITLSIIYVLCMFFNPLVYSHLFVQNIFQFLAQILVDTIMILLFCFVINLMPTTHRCFSIACLIGSAIFGETFSTFVKLLIQFFRGLVKDDVYITVITYFLITIIAIMFFYYYLPELKTIPYPQIPSDSARIEKGMEDELQRQYEDRNFQFNRKYEFSHFFKK